jgi:hypothetical protein
MTFDEIINEVSKMKKEQHILLLKLVVKNKIIYSSNKNGSFINLTIQSKEFINELEILINSLREEDNENVR